MKSLILIGGGGHCRSCIDVIEFSSQYKVAGIIECEGVSQLTDIDYPLLGTDQDLLMILLKYPAALVTVGQIKNSKVRQNLFEVLKSMSAELPTIVSSNAYCSRHAHIAAGTIVMHRAMINTKATIGENCIINSQALVEHDTVVESHCHISTGAILNGAVHVETGCFIGSGVVVREGVRIGAGCVVGAGAVVLHDLPTGTTVRRSA